MNKLVELKKLSKDISILYVEDEKDLREAVATFLKKIFATVYVAINGEDGLEHYIKERPDIIITDILMPNMNGIEMLKAIKQLSPTQNSIITSAYSESEFFLESIKLGVSSYILKPIDYAQLVDVLHTIVSRINTEKEVVEYRQNLEKLVETKVKEYQSLEHQRVEDYEKILLALVKMIEQRDSYTAGHSQRVATYSKMLAKDLGFDTKECERIYQAGILHDIGKIATPDAVLLKPDKLTEIEYTLIKEHVNVSINILKEIPVFPEVVDISGNHHERYDGQGYPHGIKGNDIPPLARVMIVADAFDAMTTSRIYRQKKSVEEALNEISTLSTIQFHPEVVKSANKIFANLKIDNEISQLPSNLLEEERFVYFYRDSVTHLDNQKYLSIVLLKNNYTIVYKYLSMISLHHFSKYNNTFGWESGDNLLRAFADLLKKSFPNIPIFRMHANDFIFLSQEALVFSTDFFDQAKALLDEHITFSVKYFSIQDQNIDSISRLEELIRGQQNLTNKPL